jgi:hypothetical protein
MLRVETFAVQYKMEHKIRQSRKICFSVKPGDAQKQVNFKRLITLLSSDVRGSLLSYL